MGAGLVLPPLPSPSLSLSLREGRRRGEGEGMAGLFEGGGSEMCVMGGSSVHTLLSQFFAIFLRFACFLCLVLYFKGKIIKLG